MRFTYFFRYFFFFFILIGGQKSVAQWSTDADINNPIARFLLYPGIVSDGNGGSFIVGQTHLGGFDKIHVQHVDAQGNLLFTGDMGMLLTLDPDANLRHQQIRVTEWDGLVLPVSDDNGGFYLPFKNMKFLYEETDPEIRQVYSAPVYLQHISYDGQKLFGEEGLRLSYANLDTAEQLWEVNNIIKDGFGGVYIRWSYQQDGLRWQGDDLVHFIARIGPYGDFIWGPNTLSSDTKYSEFFFWLDTDKKLSYYEYPGKDRDFEKVNFVKLTPENGDSLIAREIDIGPERDVFYAFKQYFFTPEGEAVFLVNEYFTDSLQIQKFDQNGNKLWGNRPILISADSVGHFDVFSDYAGGAFVWYRVDGEDTLHLLHYGSRGHITWHKLFPLWDWRDEQNVMSYFDGEEKLPVFSAQNGDVFVLLDRFNRMQRYTREGELLWDIEYTKRLPRTHDIATIFSWNHLVHPDGGVTMVWREVGDGVENFHGIRAQHIQANGQLGATVKVLEEKNGELSELILTKPWPNPFQDLVQFKMIVPKVDTFNIAIYSINGKEVISLASQKVFLVGEHKFVWQGQDKHNMNLPSGMYFLRIQNSTEIRSCKLLLIR